MGFSAIFGKINKIVGRKHLTLMLIPSVSVCVSIKTRAEGSKRSKKKQQLALPTTLNVVANDICLCGCVGSVRV